MKDAIGGSMLLNLVIIFTSVVILLFVGILAYAKAYKVKNKIIEIIESNNGEIDVDNNQEMDDLVLNQINTELGKVGYRISTAPSSAKCEQDSSRKHCESNLNYEGYKYCVCKQSSATNEGVSYEVITYVHFAFPVIGDLLTFPVRGETKVLGKDYNY